MDIPDLQGVGLLGEDGHNHPASPALGHGQGPGADRASEEHEKHSEMRWESEKCVRVRVK